MGGFLARPRARGALLRITIPRIISICIRGPQKRFALKYVTFTLHCRTERLQLACRSSCVDICKVVGARRQDIAHVQTQRLVCKCGASAISYQSACAFLPIRPEASARADLIRTINTPDLRTSSSHTRASAPNTTAHLALPTGRLWSHLTRWSCPTQTTRAPPLAALWVKRAADGGCLHASNHP